MPRQTIEFLPVKKGGSKTAVFEPPPYTLQNSIVFFQNLSVF